MHVPRDQALFPCVPFSAQNLRVFQNRILLLGSRDSKQDRIRLLIDHLPLLPRRVPCEPIRACIFSAFSFLFSLDENITLPLQFSQHLLCFSFSLS